MKQYILSLNENISEQVIVDFDAFGAKVIWASKALPHIIAVETNKTIEELEGFFLVETVTENEQGSFNQAIVIEDEKITTPFFKGYKPNFYFKV